MLRIHDVLKVEAFWLPCFQMFIMMQAYPRKLYLVALITIHLLSLFKREKKEKKKRLPRASLLAKNRQETVCEEVFLILYLKSSSSTHITLGPLRKGMDDFCPPRFTWSLQDFTFSTAQKPR